MPLPATTLALYDLLEADTVLQDLLGVHVLATGGSRPALAHFWPREAIEPSTRPLGVEVVVWRGPQGTAAAPAQTGEVDTRPTFRLSVTQWEPKPGPTREYHQQAVIERLQQLLPGANASDVTIDGLTSGLQQHTVTWVCPVAVLQPI
jgi:hypothetical protein